MEARCKVSRYPSRQPRSGFTILEAVVSIMLLALAATMVFSVTYPAIGQAFSNRNSQIARQYATQLMDEILQRPNSTANPSIAGIPGIHKSRDTIESIAAFHGYVSHMCLENGSPYSSLCANPNTAAIDSLCFRVTVETVDSNLQTGGTTDFLRVTIVGFEDPDQNLMNDDRPYLVNMVRLVREKN